MDINDVQLVGSPCGQHGPYTFYKAFKYQKRGVKKIITISEFFFVKMWQNSDLLCICELQLLWIDKNSEQTLASLRLYFLPENTPEGRVDQGEDEVLAISEKVVIRLDDLISWMTVNTEWNWGRLAKCEHDLKDISIKIDEIAFPRRPAGHSFSLSEVVMDFSDVEQEREKFEESQNNDPHVVILSFPKYCRYRSMMKRLEGVEDLYLKYKIVNALGGFYVKHPNTRVLFCRDTFDYPELEGHELLCNHLAPKLKGRPRGKRKKRSVSPASESNESESSVTSQFAKVGERSVDSQVATRRSARCHDNNENKQFVKLLAAFMKSKHLPMGRIPSLGYKELNLYEFFTRVQKLGGYDCVTANRLWKSIFDDMTGHLNSTSAATVIRRHYERLLLPFERHEKGEEDKPMPERIRRKNEPKPPEENESGNESETSSASSSSSSSSSSQSGSDNNRCTPPTCIAENKESSPSSKTSSLRSIRVKPDRQKDKSTDNQNTTELKPASETNSPECKTNVTEFIMDKDETNSPECKPKVTEFIMDKHETNSSECKLKVNDFIMDKHETNSPECKPNVTEFIKDKHKEDAKPIADLEAKLESHKEERQEIKIEKQTEVTCIEPRLEEAQLLEVLPTIFVKEEEKLKSEPDEIKPSIPEGSRSEGSILPEPSTDAVAPVASAAIPEKNMSPIEGKENFPIIKTEESAANTTTQILNVSFNNNPPETVRDEAKRGDSEEEKSAVPNVKRIKLDILKEGGLEVTPVRANSSPTLVKEFRPSVIQPLISNNFIKPSMAPPLIVSKALPRRHSASVLPSSLNITQVKHPTTPVKETKPDQFSTNNTTPPKVVQSRSIYSYSEKTIYGNPKVFLQPSMATHAPRSVAPGFRQGGSYDPMDLSLTSPQKPTFDNVSLPHNLSISQSNRSSVTKNLYKTAATPSASVLDGRKFGPNLEITLVKPKQQTALSQKPTGTHTRRGSETYAQKIAKLKSEELNSRMSKYNMQRNRCDSVPITNSVSKSINASKPDSSRTNIRTEPQVMPPYLANRLTAPENDTVNPNGLNSYMPFMDSLYYQAAIQNVYSNLSNMQHVLPIPSPEQLKFYAELMAHGRLNMPYLQPTDGNSPMNSNKKT